MSYFEYLLKDENSLKEKLDLIIENYKIEIVGSNYCECIVRKDNLDLVFEKISEVGIIISAISWWCNVENEGSVKKGCPHGMGGPRSMYGYGWYSELKNPMITLEDISLIELKDSFNLENIKISNLKMLNELNVRLSIPFLYTPTEIIEENKCVTPALWIEVPETWNNPL